MPLRLPTVASRPWRTALVVLTVVVVAAGGALALGRSSASNDGVSVWLSHQDALPTDGNFDALRRPSIGWTGDGSSAGPTITVRDGSRYQPIDGFGASFTESSAWLVSRSPQSDAIMQRLFSRSNGIGLSFLRQPLAGSDYTVGPAYTYDDLPPGQTDSGLSQFSVSREDASVIPMLQQALAINPDIKIMASPWSPPAWMKRPRTPGQPPALSGGSLNPTYEAVYAHYFQRFLEAYRQRGIRIFAVSPQNEPTSDLMNAPWSAISATDEQAFVRDYLGPVLAGSGTDILVSDDAMPKTAQYAQVIHGDQQAWRYVGGTATHCYFGGLDKMVVDQQPAYMTECSDGIHGTVYDGHNIDAIIDSIRYGARAVALWNIALDQNNGPIAPAPYGCAFSDPQYGGCTPLMTIPDDQAPGYEPTGAAPRYDPDFYYLGHASKFVLPGAVHVDSSDLSSQGIKDVAFQNPDGIDVLLVHNTARRPASLRVRWAGRSFSIEMPARSIATFTWHGGPATRERPSHPSGPQAWIDRAAARSRQLVA